MSDNGESDEKSFPWHAEEGRSVQTRGGGKVSLDLLNILDKSFAAMERGEHPEEPFLEKPSEAVPAETPADKKTS